MFCKNCGAQVPNNSGFCQNCGSKVEVNQMPQGNGMPMGNQPMNSVPPMGMPGNNMGAPMNNMSMQPAKNNNAALIIVVVAIIAVAAVALVLFMNMDKEEDVKDDDNRVEENVNNNNDNDNNNSNNNNDNNNSGNSVIEQENTTPVTYNGHTFYLPTQYLNMEYEGNLTLYDAGNTWLIMFTISQGSNFDILKTQLGEFDSILGASYSNVKSEVRTHQGVEYIFTTATTDGTDIEMIMTDLGDNEILMTLMMPVSPSVTFDQLFEIAFPIAVNVK